MKSNPTVGMGKRYPCRTREGGWEANIMKGEFKQNARGCLVFLNSKDARLCCAVHVLAGGEEVNTPQRQRETDRVKLNKLAGRHDH